MFKSSLLTPPRVISDFSMVPTNSQVLKLKPQLKISQNSSNTIQFSEIPILKSLNEALKNDDGDGLDHSHFSLQKSQANTNSPLNSLLSTLKPAPNTFFWELRPQILIKPLEF